MARKTKAEKERPPATPKQTLSMALPFVLALEDGTYFVVEEATATEVTGSGIATQHEAEQRVVAMRVARAKQEAPVAPATAPADAPRPPLAWAQDEHGAWHCQPTARLRARISWVESYGAWYADAAYLRTPDQWIGESPHEWQDHTTLEAAQAWVERIFDEMEARMIENDAVMNAPRRSMAPVKRRPKRQKAARS